MNNTQYVPNPTGWIDPLGLQAIPKNGVPENNNSIPMDSDGKGTFLSDEYYKNSNRLPESAPGVSHYNRYDLLTGELKQTKYYDSYGRQMGWVDYTNHGYPKNHTAPHWHEVIYNSKYPRGKIINHRMDNNIPYTPSLKLHIKGSSK